ncbi:MAG: cysteine peptidase family C39 domain-containing protein [Planctomycetaceae bacterium]
MADIYAGIALLSVVTGAMFFLARFAASRLSRYGTEFLGGCMLALMVAYGAELWDDVTLARILPYSNLIVIGNWFPPAFGFLAGLAWSRESSGYTRRTIGVGLLATVAIASVWQPLYGSPPKCSDLWRNGVCIQTTPASCSAACAATLLRKHGIDATEREMTELCLTRNGTTWQGLYRGLMQKTRGTPWTVEIFRHTLKELREMPETPKILIVELEAGAGVDPRYERQWGWIPGQSHAVVLMGFRADERVEIGDPAVGREYWTEHDMQVLWHGVGLRLIPR